MKYYKIINNEEVFFTGNVLHTNEGNIINPTEEQMLAAGWMVYVEPKPTAEELLAQAKLSKIAEIDAQDSSMEVFTISGQSMWLNHDLRQQLKTSVEAYIATGRSTVTKWFGGQEFTFPCQTWLQMLAVLEVYAAEVLNATEAHKVAVNALESVEAVEQYDITQGYPTPIVFTPQMLETLGK